MKKILLLILVVATSLAAKAQINVHYDTLAGISYVNIKEVEWVRNQPEASRLYVSIVNYQLIYSITISWQVRGEIQIDENTINTVVLQSGQYTIAGAEFDKWDKSVAYIFILISNLPAVDVNIID